MLDCVSYRHAFHCKNITGWANSASSEINNISLIKK